MKKGFKVLLVLMLVGLSILVLAAQLNSPIKSDVRPSTNNNLTGSINLNVTINTNMTNGNYSIVNVTFAWMNKSGNRLHNTTLFNTTPGQTSFQNSSFDTSLLPDGIYNVTITVYNVSSGAAYVNNTLAINLTIDNTAPFVNVSGLAASSNPEIQYGRNFSVLRTANLTFNATVYDFRPGQKTDTQVLTQFELSSVYFWFDNGTGNDFNVTGINNSGTWSVSYNLSVLSHGNEFQTVRVMANDSMSNGTRNNLNNSVFWNFTVDGIAPVVTASSSGVTSTAATLTATVASSTNESLNNCTYSVTNGAGGGAMTKSDSTTFTATVVLLPSTDYVATLTCNDFAGNQNATTTSFTSSAAAAASSNGGGGSGGSSGGISSSVQGQLAKEVWTSINAGETASVKVENGAIGVTEVSFGVPATVYGAWVQVAKKDSLPSTVSKFEGKVYRNLEITKGPALNKEGSFTDATVKFKVEKAWLAEKQLTKEAVALHHYENGKWTQLQTQVGEDDGTYVHYSSKTPGFSYFVIGQKSGEVAAPAAGATEQPAAEEPATEPTAEPAMEQKGMSKGLLVGLLVALVVIIAVVLWMRKRK